MNIKEEIKEYLKRTDELEQNLKGKDKETLQWLIFTFNECAKRLVQKDELIEEVIDYIRPKLKLKNKDGFPYQLFKRNHIEHILKILERNGK